MYSINDSADNTENCKEIKFCPLCQAPLLFLKISPIAHVAACTIDWNVLQRCPEGADCLNNNIFHYRDFSHSELAAYRSSSYYSSPSIDKLKPQVVKKSPSKTKSKIINNTTPTKTPNKSNKEKNYTKNKHKKTKYASSDSINGNKDKIISSSTNCIKVSSVRSDVNDASNSSDDEFFKRKKGSKRKLPESNCNIQLNKTNVKKIKTFNEDIKMPQNNGESLSYFNNINSNTDLKNEFNSRSSNSSRNIDREDYFGRVNLQVSPFKNEDLNFSPLYTEKNYKIENPEKLSLDLVENSISTDTSSISYSPLPSKISFCENIEKESSDELLKTPVKKVGIFVPKVERKCRLSINNKQLNNSVVIKNNNQYIESSANQSSFKQDNKNTLTINSKLSDICNLNSGKINKGIFDSVKEFNNDVNENFNDGVKKVENAFLKLRYKEASKIKFDKKGGSYNNNLHARSLNVSTATNEPSTVNQTIRINSTDSNTRFPGRRRNTVKKICPFFKKIPDTSLVVDAFNYGYIPGIKSYFLSHFHSDHYIGLTKSFNMPIYCSKITAELVKTLIGVDEKWLNVIDVGERCIVNGTEVVALDANHCPGSLMFLFQLRTGQNYLHVGDFRFRTEMEMYPELKNIRVHKLYLDTTYCKPQYDFPLQDDVIKEIVKISKDEMKKNPSSLIVCGSYIIGKEKVFSAVSKAYNYNIWAESRKKQIFKCLNNKSILNRLSDEPCNAQIHVLSMQSITFEKLQLHLDKYSNFTNLIAFRPTGWTASLSTSLSSIKKRQFNNIAIYDVPYSEHSSFSELRQFVKFTQPVEIIPTVNAGSPSARDEMNSYFTMWLSEKQESKQSTLHDFLYPKLFNTETPI